jgi:hypothetical protein
MFICVDWPRLPVGKVPDEQSWTWNLHFPRFSHTQAASNRSRSASDFNFAFWPGPRLAA